MGSSQPFENQKEKRARRIREFLAYLGVAAIGYAFNVGSRIVYSESLGLSFPLAVALAYFTGMVVAFTLSKLFLFDAKKSGNVLREAIKFTFVSMAALGVTLAFALIALEINNYYLTKSPDVHAWFKTNIGALGFKFINRELASHIFGTGFGFFTNFFGHKMVTFRETGVGDWLDGLRGKETND